MRSFVDPAGVHTKTILRGVTACIEPSAAPTKVDHGPADPAGEVNLKRVAWRGVVMSSSKRDVQRSVTDANGVGSLSYVSTPAGSTSWSRGH
jgi:hypothetical protein